MIQLSTREKNILAGAGILVLIFIVVQFVFLRTFDKKNDLERILMVETQTLEKVSQLQKQYLALGMDNKKGIMKTRQRDFTLFSFLDLQASKSGVKENIGYMKPFSQDMENTPYKISTVKLKLVKINLQQFINFIEGVETSKNGVKIVSLSATKVGKKQNMLDVLIETQTLMAKESV
ncbi:MAG: general secretion pathway protein GspM [Desulfobacteraceae bacterium]|nr:general secretion pathway protein GspM [Desulfobacteraceae bacterium]